LNLKARWFRSSWRSARTDACNRGCNHSADRMEVFRTPWYTIRYSSAVKWRKLKQ
jgi:hypothetical protein